MLHGAVCIAASLLGKDAWTSPAQRYQHLHAIDFSITGQWCDGCIFARISSTLCCGLKQAQSEERSERGCCALPAALDWLATNHVSPAVATLSLGVPEGQWSAVLSDSVRHLIQDHAVRPSMVQAECINVLFCDLPGKLQKHNMQQSPKTAVWWFYQDREKDTHWKKCFAQDA